MDTKKLFRLAVAARETGVNRTTIQAAVGRGEIYSETTGCGLPLVPLAAVKKWAAKEHLRKPGRKPAG